MKRIVTLVAFSLACTGIASQASAQTVIDFESNAPNLFGQTTPLTDAYASLGILFSGVTGAGGSILNDSSFSQIAARSGTDFLAFNASVGTGLIEEATFSTAVSSFSVFLAGNAGVPSFFASAYDIGGNLLGTTSVTATPGQYSELSLSFANIASVQFGATGGNVFAADDLSFDVSVVPEPESWAMMIIGMGAVGGAIRRRRATYAVRYA